MNSAIFENIVTFLKVVEVGGFLAAARELGIAQSTVSRRVSELERRLGTKLIERTTRRLLLTEAGKQYSQAVRLPLQSLIEAEDNIASDSVGMQGNLRVSIPSGFGRNEVLPSLAKFAEQYPMVRLDIDLSDRYIDLLTDECDLAIRSSEPVTSGLEVRPLKRQVELHICATPDYLNENPIQSPQDLVDAKCLVLNTYAPRSLWPVQFEGTTHRLTIRPHMLLSSIEAVYDMTLTGMGVALLPGFLVKEDLRSGRLELASPQIQLASIRHFVVWPTHKSTLMRVQTLREHLEADLV